MINIYDRNMPRKHMCIKDYMVNTMVTIYKAYDNNQNTDNVIIFIKFSRDKEQTDMYMDTKLNKSSISIKVNCRSVDTLK